MKQRDYKMDNIRFFLILCVLIGHFIELFQGELASDLYKIIYSFHMPAFLFLTGFFARFNRRKIVLNLIYPYVLFQILYDVFDAFILKEQQHVTINFGTPYWLLWYLLVTIFCYLLLPLFDGIKPVSGIIMVCICFILSLFVGFDSSMGYYGSLARFFNFLPFFIVGHYSAHLWKKYKNSLAEINCMWLIIPIGLIVLLSTYYISNSSDITRKVLYGSLSYEKADYNPQIKLLLMIISFSWISLLLLLTPNKKLPFLSVLGQHTLPVFLLHGFLIKLFDKYNFFHFSEINNLIITVFFSFILIALLGNPWCDKLFQTLFTGKWVDSISKRR